MSDFGDSDEEFENFRLVSPTTPETSDSFNRPLQVEREFSAKFTGSFLENNILGDGGFGNSSGEGFGAVVTPENEEFVGLDWDASRIFKNISCPEKNTENQVCVLRLHDILTKSELGVLKMTRQMIDCGKILNGYNPETRRDFGFEDPRNVKNLLQMIRSLRANINLMLLETEDLQELIQPEFHDKQFNEKSGKKSKIFWISTAGILTAIPVAMYFYRYF